MDALQVTTICIHNSGLLITALTGMTNIRTFIVCSSMLLLAWLAASYTTEHNNTRASFADKAHVNGANKASVSISNVLLGKTSPGEQTNQVIQRDEQQNGQNGQNGHKITTASLSGDN